MSRDGYAETLQELIASASPKALEICRAWDSRSGDNGEHFGMPGWGGVDYVRYELYKAEIAVAICCKE